MPIEISTVEEDIDGTPFVVPHTHTRYSGVLDLHAQDAFRVFRDGTAIIHNFLAPDGDGVSLLPGADEIEVRQRDLLVRKEERERYERAMGFVAGKPSREKPAEDEAASPSPPFWHSPDYREVRLGPDSFHLGAIQAEVVRALHAAHLAGDPWQSGKLLLTAAGSKSLKMVDVFKSQPGWRRLILSNHRGDYRLALDDDPS